MLVISHGSMYQTTIYVGNVTWFNVSTTIYVGNVTWFNVSTTIYVGNFMVQCINYNICW